MPHLRSLRTDFGKQVTAALRLAVAVGAPGQVHEGAEHPAAVPVESAGAWAYMAVWFVTTFSPFWAPKTTLITGSSHSGQRRRAGAWRSGAGAGAAARAAMCSSRIACAHFARCRRGVV